MHLCLFLASLAVAADPFPHTVVVRPAEFAAALEPWLEHRAAQGTTFAFVENDQSPEKIRAAIRESAQTGTLQAIVLVGDTEPQAATDTRIRARCVPTHKVPAKVNVLWGSEPEIASDNWYADLDDDQLPDVPIGRLSADTPEQLSQIVRKIIDYENTSRSSSSLRHVNFVAGVGGFGALADSVIESATRKFLTEGIPAAYDISMTYGSWRSPYCPDPRRFHEATLDRLNEGSLFWVYIGHGQRRYLDRVPTPLGRHHIFDTDDVPKLQRTGGAPIAIFLSCYTGAFDEVRDCLGEELLRSPEGPVAALCGSRVTMPYAMAVMGNDLMRQTFQQRRATLGEVIMHAKRNLARTLTEEERTADPNRQLLDALAAALSPDKDMLDEERLEHVDLFNLLGDPLLRLRHPADVSLTVDADAGAGQPLQVVFDSPIAGECIVELTCRHDRMKTVLPARDRFDPTDAGLLAYGETYARANDRVWTRRALQCLAGASTTTLDVPADATGPCHVRVFVADDTQHALGAANVYVRRQALTAPRSE